MIRYVMMRRGVRSPTVTVPNLVSLTLSEAQTAISGVSLTTGDVTYTFDSVISSGCIYSHNPAYRSDVNVGTAVDLVVSNGAAP